MSLLKLAALTPVSYSMRQRSKFLVRPARHARPQGEAGGCENLHPIHYLR
jgi:hypothetical protein